MCIYVYVKHDCYILQAHALDDGDHNMQSAYHSVINNYKASSYNNIDIMY